MNCPYLRSRGVGGGGSFLILHSEVRERDFCASFSLLSAPPRMKDVTIPSTKLGRLGSMRAWHASRGRKGQLHKLGNLGREGPGRGRRFRELGIQSNRMEWNFQGRESLYVSCFLLHRSVSASPERCSFLDVDVMVYGF